KATGQPDQPVVMHDSNTRTATADEVDYQTANQTLKMISLGLQPVTLIDKTLGTLNCRTVVFENFMHRISFFGPGHLQIQSKAASGGPWQGQWDKGLTLSFAPEKLAGAAATPDNPQGKLLLQNAIMTGDASLIGSGTYISGDVLFADITNYLAADKTVHQALSYFGATSNVSIRSWRPDDPNQQAAPDSIDCNHLQLITASSVASNPNSPPVPSLLLADGNVVATFHERSAAAKNPTSAPAGPAGRLLAIYQLGSDHLSAELVAKNSPAPGNSNLQSGRYTVGQFRLWQNLQIQIQNIDQPITATAYQLAGNAVAGTAVLTGSDPNAPWPEIQQGTNFITGQKIALNRATQSMQIDGPGEASMPSDVAADKNAKNTNNKTTVTLHWTDQMFYHGPQQMAEFDGNVTALMTGQKDPVLTCPRLQVLLYRPQQQNASLKLAKIIALSSPAQPLVVARNSSYDPAGHLLTRLYLQCIRLNYDAVNQILNIPGHGELLLQDFRPAQPGAGQERGQTGFTWDKSLEYHDASGIISLAGGVHMVFQPVQPFNTNNAEFGGALPASSGPDSKLAIMDCNQLSAKFSRQKTAPGTSLSLGLGGQTRLTQVQAQEGAIQLSGITIAADVLEFDAVNQQAIAYSMDGREASVSDVKGQYHGEYEKAIWDMTKGRSGLELINPRGAIEVQQ
ncbi:MAG TPA: hypothetical protein VKJ65_03810, partial [Phycisphaerae bacterium]|nr:hypothetical protein [Phycisphaerae bacterium]